MLPFIRRESCGLLRYFEDLEVMSLQLEGQSVWTSCSSPSIPRKARSLKVVDANERDKLYQD